MWAVVDFTTHIGCTVGCLKYCPQELIVGKYIGNRHLSLETFQEFMETVPLDTAIRFTGVSEPFINQECPDMILWAHEQGYKVVVYSTLVGLTPQGADRIIKIPFEKFTLHLPDALGNAKIKITPDYLTTLGKILTGVNNLEFMNMGPYFKTNNNENIARGKITKRKSGRMGCDYLDTPGYQVLPNGEVYFCCITRGVSGYVGSLRENTYWDLANPETFARVSYKMQTHPDSLCHKCDFSYPYWYGYLKKTKAMLFGNDRTLKEIAEGIITRNNNLKY